ncbi:MAG: filamentous hemagglutinin N-terminal domain-containing protein, partial [Pyrinomonadaceae bacterium]|nr:filamentous hemagglutinin N-terminal domain-containing protein [Phycisphaerales bacterium]
MLRLKSSLNSSVRVRLLAAAAGTSLALTSASRDVCAQPQGAQVVHGDVTVRQGPNLTQITASNNSIINFRSFNIAREHTVQFVQPDASARVLNRIAGPGPTLIEGSLRSNGQVYLLNPAGVLFSRDAVVNVGSLVAGAARMSDADFLSGRMNFTDAAGQVVNHGHISATHTVALVGEQVANTGVINVPDGTVVLAAGDRVLIGERTGRVFVQVDMPSGRAPSSAGAGIEQSGTINAPGSRVAMGSGDLFSLAIRHTGRTVGRDITLQGTGAGRVAVSGTVDASDQASTTGAGEATLGGRIEVLGHAVHIHDGVLNASGRRGGGEIRVGGELGGGAALPESDT